MEISWRHNLCAIVKIAGLGRRLREQMAMIRQKLSGSAVLEERNQIARGSGSASITAIISGRLQVFWCSAFAPEPHISRHRYRTRFHDRSTTCGYLKVDQQNRTLTSAPHSNPLKTYLFYALQLKQSVNESKTLSRKKTN